jgi:catechol 2,3-dioxygenase-like lactoylglutathione lyase family enzyme
LGQSHQGGQHQDGLTFTSPAKLNQVVNYGTVNRLRISKQSGDAMSVSSLAPTLSSSLPDAAPIHQLHHYAYRAKDAEETRHFYEDILGLPLYHIIQSDVVPSTGEYCPYTHFFFRLRDGSFIAFFDLGDDQAALPSPNTPMWVNHISFRVDNKADLQAMKERLQAHGVEVLGITDHHIFESIYFFDPNGVRLELTAQRADEFQMLQESKTVHARLNEWTARKQQWRQERAEGKAAQPLKPQQNDRPEFKSN